MNTTYKGFIITVERMSPNTLRVNAIRMTDGWELVMTSFDTEDKIREVINKMQENIDEFLANPEIFEVYDD
jgi:hypothetical protein